MAERAVDWRFLALLAGGTGIGAVPAWIWVARWEGGRAGLAAGLAFSLVSLALGFHWILWSAAGSPGRFAAAVLGSTLSRGVLLLAFALALAYGTAANLAVALLTVVAMHLVFGLVEIAWFQRTEALR